MLSQDELWERVSNIMYKEDWSMNDDGKRWIQDYYEDSKNLVDGLFTSWQAFNNELKFNDLIVMQEIANT